MLCRVEDSLYHECFTPENQEANNVVLPSFALMIILTRTVSEMCGEEEDNVLMEQLMCCQVVHLS